MLKKENTLFLLYGCERAWPLGKFQKNPNIDRDFQIARSMWGVVAGPSDTSYHLFVSSRFLVCNVGTVVQKRSRLLQGTMVSSFAVPTAWLPPTSPTSAQQPTPFLPPPCP